MTTTLARRSDPGRPVSRLVSPVLMRLAILVALAVVVCVVGVFVSSQSVDDLTDDLEPAGQAHDDVVQSLEDVETATSAWALVADPVARQDFAAARSVLDEAIADLEAIAEGDSELTVLITTETTDIDRWVDEYARPVLDAPGATAELEADRFALGQRLWDSYRQSRDATDALLAQRFQRASDSATIRFNLTIIAALLVLAASWMLIGRARTRLLAELSMPLLALEQVVQRMLRNDPEGRAADDRGPTEVRAIARAINDFAGAQLRARAVEGRIQDELHVLDSAKDDFVSNVSHELRTPLTTISGYLEMVADEFEGRLEPRHDRMLEASRRNVVRLRALIDDLLALSKAENRPTELEPSDVVEMVGNAVTDVRMTGARRGIAVELSAPDEAMLVVCDRAMLYRAFLNVLSNAVKFSHDDGSVEVSVRRVLNRVEIAVRDHGIGIPRAELDRLGTRFFRASNARTNEIAGTGLGLRIVQTIIDKHAGDVVIESAEGEGTTVFVRLRLHGERVAARPGIRRGGEAFTTMSTGSGSRRAPLDDPEH